MNTRIEISARQARVRFDVAALAGAVHRFPGFMGRMGRYLIGNHRRRAEARRLMEMDDHLLADIGLTREDISHFDHARSSSSETRLPRPM